MASKKYTLEQNTRLAPSLRAMIIKCQNSSPFKVIEWQFSIFSKLPRFFAARNVLWSTQRCDSTSNKITWFYDIKLNMKINPIILHCSCAWILTIQVLGINIVKDIISTAIGDKYNSGIILYYIITQIHR